jgi:hypothetical protein
VVLLGTTDVTTVDDSVPDRVRALGEGVLVESIRIVGDGLNELNRTRLVDKEKAIAIEALAFLAAQNFPCPRLDHHREGAGNLAV